MAVLKFKNKEKKTWEEVDVVNDGVTFIPSIDDDGNLSWSNNGHLENPHSINISGNTIIMRPTKSEFPIPGQEYAIYIDRQTNVMYRWDIDLLDYVPLSASTSGEFSVEIVDVLPATNISTTTIYMVPNGKTDPDEKSHYDEYIFKNGAWELLGSLDTGSGGSWESI